MRKTITFLVVGFFFISSSVRLASAVGCGGVVKCSPLDRTTGTCGSTIVDAKGCTGTDPASCIASELTCGIDQCESGGCYWENPDGSTTSSCPAECRKEKCGTGYSTASGCPGSGPNFGCKTGQVCCKAKSCPAPCTNSNPLPPVLQQPANGITISDPTVLLMWAPPTNWGKACTPSTKWYEVFVGTDSTSLPLVATITDGTDSDTVPDATEYLYTIPDTTSNTVYYWQIKAYNGAARNATSAQRTFIIGATSNIIAGTVYDDPTGTCSTSTPLAGDGVMGVSWGSYSALVNGSGDFMLDAGTDTGPNPLSLVSPIAGYGCTPGCNLTGCYVKPNIPASTTGGNYTFFLTSARFSWWQAEGAGVYAGATSGESVKSLLPTSSTRLVTAGTASNVGAVMTPSDATINVGTQGGLISDSGWQARSRYRGKRTDYAYFATLIGLTSSRASDWTGSDEITKPVYDPDKVFWYRNGNAHIGSDWSVASGEKYIVFVNGDLVIDSDFTIDPGGFAAFIVKGSVTVAPSATARSISGLYVMDGLFVSDAFTDVDDGQLVMYGSVVTWSGVSLYRDLGGTVNALTPAEKFVYRPDLLINMPDAMKSFALNWHEVAPGTFGN